MNIYSVLPQMGALSKWIAQKEKEAEKLFGRELKLWFADANNALAIDAIAKLVSDILTIPVIDLLRDSRELEVVEARQIIMYLCSVYISEIKPSDIGQTFKKDRTTVIYAVGKIKDRLYVKDASITDKVGNCEAELLKRINGMASEIPTFPSDRVDFTKENVK